MSADRNVDQQQTRHQRGARGPKDDPRPAGRSHFGLSHVAQGAEQIEIYPIGQTVAWRRPRP